MGALNDSLSTLVSVVRVGRGWFTSADPGPRPAKTLELYDFES